MVTFLAIFLSSCSDRKSLHFDELEGYVRSTGSGFVQRAEIGEFIVEIMYRPPALQAYSNAKHLRNPSEAHTDSLKKSFNNLINIGMRIRHSANIPFDELVNEKSGEGLAYMIGTIAQQLSIEYGDSVSLCLFHHFERDYGLSPYGVVDIAFRRPSTSDKIVFIYDDLLFNMGPIRFNIPLKQLDESFKIID